MYCFEMRVRDKNRDVGTFVVLDGEGTKIAGRSVRDVLNEYMEAVGKDSYEGINTKWNTSRHCTCCYNVGNGNAPTCETDDGEVVEMDTSFFLKHNGNRLQQVSKAAYVQFSVSQPNFQYLTE
ncbi:hypothetical protein AtEden1_Chr5g0113581 [Arabidopsis thaliana]